MAEKFVGQQMEREPLYEAHLFVRAAPEAREGVRQLAREHGFRLSARPKAAQNGMLDLLVTKNDDDRTSIETDMRRLADHMVSQGFGVYRIRLEQMIFDELSEER